MTRCSVRTLVVATISVGLVVGVGPGLIGGPSAAAQVAPDPAPPFPLGDTFSLASRPGSDRTIYLDLDGHVATGTDWGDEVSAAPYDLDGDPSTFSDAELVAIQHIWLGVAEDFAPFEVNVTTAEPAPEQIDRADVTDDTYGTRVAIGARTPAFEGPTIGLAYVGVFDLPNRHAEFQPAWVDSSTLATAEAVAHTATHEVGHTLGLSHLLDPGPGDGWEPIMLPNGGDAASIRQWAVGTSELAFAPQDPLAVMASHGVVARVDDHGDDLSTATPLGPVDALRGEGVISTRTDVDVFTFESVSGRLELRVDPAAVNPNLDIRAELLDAGGALVAWSDPPGSSFPDGLGARLSTTVEAGTYHLRIDGVGYTSPTGGGWSDYGSLGQYTISGQVEVRPAIDSLSVSTTDVLEGGTVTVSGSYSGTGAAVPTATAVWSDGIETGVDIDDTTATFSSSRTFDDDAPSGTPSDLVTVAVTLGTDAGEDSATSPAVTVRNVAPLINRLAPSTTEIGTGQTVTVQGSFADPALGVPTETFLAQAVWSDGEATPVIVDGGAGTFSTTRTFTADDLPTGTTSAPFTVTVTVADDDTGASSSTSATITVRNTDIDGDGVDDDVDLCAGTVLPDEPTVRLLPNRYRATGNGFVAGNGTAGPSLAETRGCSAAQIVEASGLGKGHLRFGLSAGVLRLWVAALA